VLSQPPYSPDLARADLFVFLKLQIAMKGTRFEAVSSVQQTVTRELKAIREEAFSRALDSLYERCKLCAEAGGDYTESCINKFFFLFCVVFYGLSSGTYLSHYVYRITNFTAITN
jgi:hypothetical protein